MREIERESGEVGRGAINLGLLDNWQEVANDDDINEP